MTRRVLGTLLAALLAAAGPARADSFLDRSYGTPQSSLSARSRAMGGTGAALPGGAFSLIDNPAALTLARGSRLQLSGALVRASENRFVPLYDTFGSFVAEAAVAVNDNDYGSLNGGAVLDRRDHEGVVVAAGIFDRYDPRYDYFDERRNTALTDDIVAERFIRTRGVLRTASLGAAYPLGPTASLGAALHAYFGRLSDRDALVPRSSAASASDTTLERKLSGFSATFGGALAVGERLELGLAFETAPRVRDEFTRTGNDSVLTRSRNHLRLPWRLQGGVSYRPRNLFRTTVAADVIYVPWSRTDDPLEPGLELHDTWEVRFGLEHVYYNALPGRIGFRYAPSYAMRGADRATLAFGVGYKVERFRIDLAGEIGKRSSRQDPLIPRVDQPAAVGAGRDRVEDTLLGVTLGTEVEF